MTMYAIVAHVQQVTDDGWMSSRMLPTFYLDSDVQGIVSADHAARVAGALLLDATGPDARVIVAASSETDTGTALTGECDGCDQDPWTRPVHYGTCPLNPSGSDWQRAHEVAGKTHSLS